MNFGNKVQKNVLEELKTKSDSINLASKEYFTVLGKLSDEKRCLSTFKDYKMVNIRLLFCVY